MMRGWRASAGLISLLRTAADGEGDWPVETFDERLIPWVLETGLGPLLFRAAAHHPRAVTFPLWTRVHAANVTARLLTAEQLDAMTDIIDACRDEVPPLVLLKGISICEQYYPEPHLRPMRDIDVLAEPDAIARVESILSTLGYCQPSQKPAAFYATHHHSSPFFHPDTGVWVDVHRALVAPTSELRSDRLFSIENLGAQLRPSEFRGRPVRRLSDELQIVHLSCHWAHRLQVVGGMVAMVDMACLVKNAPAIHWARILDWTKDSVAARYLYLLLKYLTQHGLVDVHPDVLGHLRLTQGALDRVTLELGHALLDRYVVNGHDFSRLMTERTLGRVWRTLVLRRPPSRGLFLHARPRRDGAVRGRRPHAQREP